MKKHLNTESLAEYEKGLTPEERRKLDLVHQVLNNHSNFSEERSNIRDLLVTYEKLLCKNDVTLSNSLLQSVGAIKDQSKITLYISQLQSESPKSHLIMPLMSNDHVFAAVWRKIDNGYSATIVNKGGRPFATQFVEYQMDEYHMKNLVNSLVATFGQKTIPSIYRDFADASAYTYKLNIVSKDQKVGNCFIKEPENAIKFAFATANFNKENFQKLREGNLTNKSKWNTLTDDMHKEFTLQIAQDNPNLQKILNNEYNIYSQNKKFRELIEQGKSIEESFGVVFGKVDISKLNIDTLSRFNIAGKLKTYFKEDQSTFAKINNIIRLARTNYGTNQHLFNSGEVIDKINRASEHFPSASRQLAFEAQSQYFGNACYCLSMSKKDKKFEIAALNCVNTAIDLYPYYFNTHAVKGVYFMDCEKNYDEAVIHLSKAIELKEQANTYYLRALAYQKLGKLELSKDDMMMAKQLNPTRYKEWENMNHLDVVLDYFACPEKFKTLNNKESQLCLSVLGVKTQSKLEMRF